MESEFCFRGLIKFALNVFGLWEMLVWPYRPVTKRAGNCLTVCALKEKLDGGCFERTFGKGAVALELPGRTEI